MKRAHGCNYQHCKAELKNATSRNMVGSAKDDQNIKSKQLRSCMDGWSVILTILFLGRLNPFMIALKMRIFVFVLRANVFLLIEVIITQYKVKLSKRYY